MTAFMPLAIEKDLRWLLMVTGRGSLSMRCTGVQETIARQQRSCRLNTVGGPNGGGRAVSHGQVLRPKAQPPGQQMSPGGALAGRGKSAKLPGSRTWTPHHSTPAARPTRSSQAPCSGLLPRAEVCPGEPCFQGLLQPYPLCLTVELTILAARSPKDRGTQSLGL